MKLNQNSGQQNEKELEKWLRLPDADTGELFCDNLMLGGIGGRRTTEDEMAGWHHRLDGREFE